MFNSYMTNNNNDFENAVNNFANDVLWIKDVLFDELKEWPMLVI